MKNAYLAIKFYEDNQNKKLIEDISDSLLKAGIKTTVMSRDYENWGKTEFSSEELMKLTFELINKSELLIVEFSEKGVGIGIEAGYAFAKNIPIIVIAKQGSDISNTLRGLAREVIFYNNPRELEAIFKKL